MEGWIKLHRSLLESDVWTCEPFSRGQAWVDLLLLANHKDSFFYKRGNKIDVKRGQLGRSSVELSDRWKWSRSKVSKFLKDLEKEQQINVKKSAVTQIVTIINYDEFQSKEQQTEQQKSSRKTTEEQQKDTYKNDNKEKNENKYLSNPDFFNSIMSENFIQEISRDLIRECTSRNMQHLHPMVDRARILDYFKYKFVKKECLPNKFRRKERGFFTIGICRDAFKEYILKEFFKVSV